MKRLIGVLAAIAVLAGGCSNPNEDADELRSFVRQSEREPRTFSYREASEDQAFAVRGSVQDELRYAMVLTSGRTDIMDYVVRDDALAVRLRDPSFGARLANVLGDPVVDAALKEGRWVVDPAGAPPLFESEVKVGGESTGDPFRVARDALRFVQTGMGSARLIKEFTLEDVTYRSSLDPWRYPPKEGREKRYDLLRPPLPVSEAQTLRGQGDIGPPQFRKTSVFVSGRRVREICSLVDVEGHEEFIELRRRGLNSNPFLARLLKRIEKRETSIPIVERYVFARIAYPKQVSVVAPGDAVTGKLETFISALEGAFSAGVLKPKTTPDTRACRRRQTES